MNGCLNCAGIDKEDFCPDCQPKKFDAQRAEVPRITAAEAAADVTGVEAYQAGQWRQVERVTLDGDTVAVRFAGGGSHVAPVHFFMFRRMEVSQTNSQCPIHGIYVNVFECPDCLTAAQFHTADAAEQAELQAAMDRHPAGKGRVSACSWRCNTCKQCHANACPVVWGGTREAAPCGHDKPAPTLGAVADGLAAMGLGKSREAALTRMREQAPGTGCMKRHASRGLILAACPDDCVDPECPDRSHPAPCGKTYPFQVCYCPQPKVSLTKDPHKINEAARTKVCADALVNMANQPSVELNPFVAAVGYRGPLVRIPLHLR